MGDVHTLYSATFLGSSADQQLKAASLGSGANRRTAVWAQAADGTAQTSRPVANGTGVRSAKAVSAYQPDTSRQGNPQDAQDYSELEDSLASHGLKLKFKVDDETDIMQVEVLDSETGKTVRKLPPDNLLKLTASIKELSRGLLDSSF